MQDMGVDAVLQCNTPVEQGGVLTRTLRGQLCYDMAALTQQLKQRYATIVICAHIQCARVHVLVSAYTFTYVYIHERVCYMNICVCRYKYMYMQFASHESVPANTYYGDSVVCCKWQTALQQAHICNPSRCRLLCFLHLVMEQVHCMPVLRVRYVFGS